MKQRPGEKIGRLTRADDVKDVQEGSLTRRGRQVVISERHMGRPGSAVNRSAGLTHRQYVRRIKKPPYVPAARRVETRVLDEMQRAVEENALLQTREIVRR